MTRVPWRQLGRGLLLRCPRCGSGGLFHRWLRIVPHCPRCGLILERGERDYFSGAMMFNIVAAEMVFAVALFVAVVLTWPAPPWNVLFIGGALAMIGLPFALYPVSKTVWLAVDLVFRPPTEDGRTEAAEERLELPDAEV